MANRKALNIVVLVLAVIGVVALIGWLTMTLMMGGSMMDGMSYCGGSMGVGMIIGGLVLIAIVAAVVLLVSRTPKV